MRITLEELKAMNADQLFEYWVCGRFPFEYIFGCGGGCLTMHASRGCKTHQEIQAETKRMGFDVADRNRESLTPVLHAHLEELYALRLFYDSLYPQPAPELFEAVATKEAHAEVCEKNLI